MSIKVDDALKHLESLRFNIDLDYKIWKEALDYFCNKDDLDGLVKYMSKKFNFHFYLPCWSIHFCNMCYIGNEKAR